MVTKRYQDLLIPMDSSWQNAIRIYLEYHNTNLKEYLGTALDDDYLTHDFLDEIGFLDNDKWVPNQASSDEYFVDLLYRDNYFKSSPFSENDLMIIEKNIQHKLPDDLKDLYSQNGIFKVDGHERYLFSLFKPNKNINVFYLKTEFLDINTLTEENYSAFNDRFIIVGISYFGDTDERKMILFYDIKLQKFGEFPYLPDDQPTMKDEIFPKLFLGELSNYNLAEIIIIQLNRILLIKLFDADNGLLTEDYMINDEYSQLVTSCPVISGL